MKKTVALLLSLALAQTIAVESVPPAFAAERRSIVTKNIYGVRSRKIEGTRAFFLPRSMSGVTRGGRNVLGVSRSSRNLLGVRIIKKSAYTGVRRAFPGR